MNRTPLPIGLVITELDVGGAEQCLVNIACSIDRQRFIPHVFVLSGPPRAPYDELARRLRSQQIPTIYLGLTRSWQFLQAVGRLRRQLQEHRLRVVLSFLFHANVVAAAAVNKVPDISLACGIRVADPAVWRQHLERRAVKRADRVICVSQSVADFVRTKLHVSSDLLQVIPNGIALNEIDASAAADLTRFGLPPGRRALTVVGRLDYQKGIDWLLELIPRLLDKLPTHDLLLVGRGPARSDLEEQAARLGIAERVHFAGWQPKIPAILKASDLLLLPSRWEGMPNVLLEAMACHLPVVCRNAEGVREVLGPLAPAQTAADNDPQVFIDTVLAILNTKQLRAHLAAENRRRVANFFSRQAMIQAYETLFQTLGAPSESVG